MVDLGMARDQAHEVLRTASFQALSSGDELLAVCERTEAITNLVDTETLASMFDPMSHVGSSAEIVDRTVLAARNDLNRA